MLDREGFTVVVPDTRPAWIASVRRSGVAVRDSHRTEMLSRIVRVAWSSAKVADVIVVSDDDGMLTEAVLSGARPVRARPPRGLNQAARQGRNRARLLRPDSPVAVLTPELHGLRVQDLDAAFTQFEQVPRGSTGLMVADLLTIDTTMLIHAGDVRPPIRFGPDSARAHVRAGYSPASGALLSLRTTGQLESSQPA